MSTTRHTAGPSSSSSSGPPVCLLPPECDSNNNAAECGKILEESSDPLAIDPHSIWSTAGAPSLHLAWSPPADLSLFGSQQILTRPSTLLNRQPSAPDSSYDSDDADGDLTLTKIVSDIVDSESPPGTASALQTHDLPLQASESISSILLSDHHTEVGRTVSDTLAQEYPEWNIPQPKATTTTFDDFDCVSFTGYSEKPKAVPETPPKTVRSLEEDLQNPELARLYEGKLKFAKKLGYTEAQVALAIDRVGYHVSKNDFLNELIAIGNDTIEVPGTVPKKDASASGASSPRPASDLGSSGPGSLDVQDQSQPPLRPIVIDGSNVAISHGNKECFSSRGLQICIDWFRARGHTEITAFVPLWRKQHGQRFDLPTIDREILLQLEFERVLTFTPAKNIAGRQITCHDDRYILNLALKNGGIVVSNDHFRDLVSENPDYRKVVDERQLMYLFVGDEFMPPDDPLGRDGPTLDDFLRMPAVSPSTLTTANFNQPCPYSIKCTYGKKCKFFHPGRLQSSIADHLREKQKLSGQSSVPVVVNKNKRALKPQNSLPLNLCAAKATSGLAVPGPLPFKAKLNLCRTSSIAHPPPIIAPNPAFDASVSRFLKAAAEVPPRPQQPTPAPLHAKLERQLTLNPYSNIIRVPSYSLANLAATSTSNPFFASTTSSLCPPVPVPRVKQKLAQTKSCGNPSSSSVDHPGALPFSLKPSKSSHNLN